VDAETLRCVLTFAGASSELFGLWLVVKDANAARRHAAAVRSREVRGYPAPMRARSKVTAAPTVTVRAPPTLEERIDALERELPRVTEALSDRVDRVDDDAQDAASRAGGEAKSHADDLDRSLRDFIANALGGSYARLGVGFFAFGVLASAAANLVG
jgi:hypothetical protein